MLISEKTYRKLLRGSVRASTSGFKRGKILVLTDGYTEDLANLSLSRSIGDEGLSSYTYYGISIAGPFRSTGLNQTMFRYPRNF